ncbi:MAG TPA: family 10 glycosylhydrolase, partial [Armatimonadota bacterium]|nr:family 10 glycosylhydrolase [Armatimonadota bacterium]
MTLSLAACLLALIQVPTANAAEKPLVGFYISTGDNDWLWQSPPVSSEASIRATFEASRRIFGVDRIYWRGFQSELLLGHFEVRPENFTGSGFWEWERHLLDEVGTSRMAVDIAREQGLEIWGMTGFFEHGASPATDAAKGYGPSVIEDRLRIEHPEWIPVDRRGIRRQAGPLELAYPAARKAQVKRYVKLLTEGGYDGVMFYNYVENFAIRFEDEFGFNEPIVREYKRRYGRDIRTEEFDHNAWYRLRGEYVTQFVRELSEGLHAAGKKFGITIDPQESHLPQPWLASRETINSGKVYLDWERWVREGLLDELQVYLNGDKEAAINNAIAICGEVDCPVSVVQGWSFADKHQHFYDAGVRCIGVGNSLEIEQGLKEPQTLAALDSDDPLAKLGLIHQSGEGDVELTLAQLTRLARDEDVLVRRQALVALGKTGVAEAVAEIEAG